MYHCISSERQPRVVHRQIQFVRLLHALRTRALTVSTAVWRARRLRLKCDETRFSLSAKRTSPFKSARGRASVQSTTDSRGVRIRGSNAGYTMFEGSVKRTGHPLHSPVSPFTSPPVRHRVPSHFSWTLHTYSHTSETRRTCSSNNPRLQLSSLNVSDLSVTIPDLPPLPTCTTL